MPKLRHVVHLHTRNLILPRGTALKNSIIQPVEPFCGTCKYLPPNPQVEGSIRFHFEIILEERAKVGGAIGEVYIDCAHLFGPWIKLDIGLVIRRIGRKVQKTSKLESRTASGVCKELVIMMARPIGAELEVVPPAN